LPAKRVDRETLDLKRLQKREKKTKKKRKRPEATTRNEMDLTNQSRLNRYIPFESLCNNPCGWALFFNLLYYKGSFSRPAPRSKVLMWQCQQPCQICCRTLLSIILFDISSYITLCFHFI
jgi:hypothetical protein